jgi:hypothetical protein
MGLQRLSPPPFARSSWLVIAATGFLRLVRWVGRHGRRASRALTATRARPWYERGQLAAGPAASKGHQVRERSWEAHQSTAPMGGGVIEAMSFAGDGRAADDEDQWLVSASELREFVYCERAWFLRWKGTDASTKARVRMKAGTAYHEARAIAALRGADPTLMRWAFGLLAVAALAMAMAVWLIWSAR